MEFRINCLLFFLLCYLSNSLDFCPINCLQCWNMSICIICKSQFTLDKNLCIIRQDYMKRNLYHNEKTNMQPKAIKNLRTQNKNIVAFTRNYKKPNIIMARVLKSSGYRQDSICRLQIKGICVLCGQKYKLGPGGLCIQRFDSCEQYEGLLCKKCNKRFQLQNGQCIDLGCKSSGFSCCNQCLDGYQMDKYYQCHMKNCTQYQRGKCTKCETNFQLMNGICTKYEEPAVHKNMAAKANILNCQAIDSSSKCLECYKGYYLDTINNACIRNNPMCQTSEKNGLCKTCFQGYYLKEGFCWPQKVDSLYYYSINCKKVNHDKQQCSECIDRYFKQGSRCRPVSALCDLYNNQTGECLSCYPGYKIQNGACIAKPEPENCKEQDFDILQLQPQIIKCKKCQQGYYLQQGNCKKASILCLKVTQKGQCESCIYGYFKNKLNNCVKYALGSDSNCQEYEDEQGYCIRCKQGLELQNFVCI